LLEANQIILLNFDCHGLSKAAAAALTSSGFSSAKLLGVRCEKSNSPPDAEIKNLKKHFYLIFFFFFHLKVFLFYAGLLQSAELWSLAQA